jgi:internalin A
VSFISEMPNLKFVGLGNNSVSDISALYNLKNINYLDLRNNHISDISVLANLTSLINIDMGGIGIASIEVLAPLKNLEVLQVSNNNLLDISVVIHFKKLRYLDAGMNILLENIDAVKDLQYLNYLDLQSDNIKDLTPIIECQGMRNPSYLNIRHNPLSETAKNEQVPLLQARGVYVDF